MEININLEKHTSNNGKQGKETYPYREYPYYTFHVNEYKYCCEMLKNMFNIEYTPFEILGYNDKQDFVTNGVNLDEEEVKVFISTKNMGWEDSRYEYISINFCPFCATPISTIVNKNLLTTHTCKKIKKEKIEYDNICSSKTIELVSDKHD